MKKWFYGMPILDWLSYRIMWWFVWCLNWIAFRTKYTGLDALPKKEPYLLLANHSSMLDPFWVGHPIYRPSRFMGSAQMLKTPYLGAFLRKLGTFPKIKYVKDKEAMETLQNFYDQGFVITLFPEGNRSWDGKTTKIAPGIGRLVKRLQSPVVYGRLKTAYFFQPRWARYPRWVPIEIEYDGPYHYSDHQTVDDITADVQRRLHVQQQLPASYLTWGFRMAEGLPNYMWACPSCFAVESLRVVGKKKNAVQCSVCTEQWTLNTQCVLQASGQSFTVEEAMDTIKAHFGTPPRFPLSTGIGGADVVLEIPHMTIVQISKEQGNTEVWNGVCVVTTEGVGSADGSIHFPFCRIEAISMELGSALFVRFQGDSYRLGVGSASICKIEYVLCSWYDAIRKETASI